MISSQRRLSWEFIGSGFLWFGLSIKKARVRLSLPDTGLYRKFPIGCQQCLPCRSQFIFGFGYQFIRRYAENVCNSLNSRQAGGMLSFFDSGVCRLRDAETISDLRLRQPEILSGV